MIHVLLAKHHQVVQHLLLLRLNEVLDVGVRVRRPRGRLFPFRSLEESRRMNNSVDVLVPVFRDVCQQAVEPDGLVFAVHRLEGQAIKEDADDAGVRVTFQAFFENARVPMQIDIGFGSLLRINRFYVIRALAEQ